MTDVEVLRMPLTRHRMFVIYQNHYVKQLERASRR
jgi:hypothetical protein